MDENQNKSSIGSIIAAIIIIALIVLGGLYFWGKRIEETKNIQSLTAGAEPTASAEDQAAQDEATAIKTTSSSDDINSIQTDLQNTNTSNLAPELNATSTQ